MKLFDVIAVAALALAVAACGKGPKVDANFKTCPEEIGPKAAADLLAQCRAASKGDKYALCEAANPSCDLLRDEIANQCADPAKAHDDAACDSR